MLSDLYKRLQKVIREEDTDILEPKRLLELTIATTEAVKAHQIACGYHFPSELQAFDRVSGVLRNCR